MHEKALLMSVTEFRWDFPREVRYRCASTAPSLLVHGGTHASLEKRAHLLLQKGHKTCMMRVPIPFCPLRLSITVPFAWCCSAWLHGVLVAHFARVYFFAVFCDLSRRWRAPAWRCPASVHFASSFALFALFTIIMSSGSRGGMSA